MPLKAPAVNVPGDQTQIARQFDREGTPVGARSLSSDSRGFFWVAADTGLYQFDGKHFYLFDSHPARLVQTTSDGWIWVGGKDGLHRLRNGERTVVLRESITALLGQGTKITAAGDRLWSGDATRIEPFSTRPNGGLIGDRNGNVWFGCGTSICELGASRQIQRREVASQSNRVWLGAASDDNGNIWAWDGQMTTLLQQGSDPVFYDWPYVSRPEDTHVGLRMNDGTIQISEYASIQHGQLFAKKPPSGGRDDFPQLQTDAYGNLWAANPGSGLELLSPKSWITGWGTAIFPNGCHSITRSGQRLLASCASGVFQFVGYGDAKQASESSVGSGIGSSEMSSPAILIRRHEDWKMVTGTEAGAPVWTSSGSPDGGIWSIFARRGIIHAERNGKEKETTWRGVRPKNLDFRSLFRDPEGELWVGAKGGLFRIDEETGHLEKQNLPNGSSYATSFAIGPDGQAWLGFDGGIAQRRKGRWELVVPREALLSSQIRSIAVGAGPTIWVAYRTALPFSRMELVGHKWERKDFSAEAGYGPPETRSLLVDSRGWIWRSSPSGIFVSDGTHLAQDDWLQLHTLNNLPDDSSGAFAFLADTDGSVWVATDGGVAHIRPDPAWFVPEKLPPPRVTALRWRGHQLLWPLPGTTIEDAGGDLQIDFAQWPSTKPIPAGLNYRLLPLETVWRSIDSGVASYSNLKTGRYRFEVRSRAASVAIYSFQVVDTDALLWPSTVLAMFLATAMLLLWYVRRGPLQRKEYWKEKEAFLAVQAGHFETETHIGETVAGRYRIVDRIGEGGFASVWKATDLVTGMPVAVKFLNVQGEIEDWQISRFNKETEALGRIDHPGIVRLLDSGRDEDGGVWLVIAWIDGPDLRTVLRSGPITRERTAAWVLQIGAALAEAHSQGVLHRDLKPENVLIEHWGGEGERVVVVDFGAATVENGLSAQSAVHLGSFDYMAPERVQGRSSTASDVYGLAAVAFEMLTGVRYAGVAASSAEGMRRLLAGMPGTVAETLATGLTYSPEDRPKNIYLFAVDLAESLRRVEPE